MVHFIRQGYNEKLLGILNRCQLYLQVLTISDIMSADGKYILPFSFLKLETG
jgi:hypothetical protein